MAMLIDVEYLGYRLLQRGFSTWFKYMFRIVENRRFIVEPLHNDLFNMFVDIYNHKIKRANINVPPRSAKTTLAQYFIAYCWTKNPRCNFIYTSYSQSLLASIAAGVANILEHPAYQAMYPYSRMLEEDVSTSAIDDFWRDYLYEETGKNVYSAKKIVTYKGGTCLFSSIGSQITGYGCGIRNFNGFSGALIIDDANKPADIRHQTLREKVVTYYEETLLSRLNNADVPIINIQQRLHVQDLSGVLQQKYCYKTLRKPLLDDKGKCQLPSQYTQERINELKTNNYMFSAQYQQQPIILGGQVIRRDWFKYYETGRDYHYKRILITADTAMKVKQHNDYSVFIVGGVTPENKLHIIDMVRGKWEAPDLKKVAVQLFEQHKVQKKTGVTCSGLYVEDKASGVGLIQELQRVGIPIVGIKVDADKLTRVENVLTYIQAGQVMLPNSENYGFNKDLLDECESFTRDDSHLHDDIVDALVYNITEALCQNKVSLLDYFMN